MSNDIYTHLTQADYDTEEWRDIQDFEGFYQVSNLGRVKSIPRFALRSDGSHARPIREQILKPHTTKFGYLRIGLHGEDVYRKFPVHRLVATAFIKNPKKLPQVNHKNGIKTDNQVRNLEWVSARENAIHAYSNGLTKPSRGESHYACKLSDNDCIEIINRYIGGGFTHQDIADEYGISRTYVSQLINGKRRKSVMKNENTKAKY